MSFVPINVKEIMNGYKKYMLPEHKQQFKDFDKLQQKFIGSQIVFYNGEVHWNVCPWSWGNTSDRCPCFSYETNKECIEKIIKLYSSIYVRKKNIA